MTLQRIALAPDAGPAGRRVPPRALSISLAALAIPVIVVFAFPDWTSTGFGTLIWLSALIPAFLLAYYRGLRGVAVALAGGMAVITATQVSVALFEITEPNWTLLLAIVTVYLVVSIGIALLAEALRTERRTAEDLALVDRLTGLPNRRRLDLTLESAFAAAVRGHSLAITMFDLDHFKRVNDIHGHAKGDDVLRRFAAILHENTRLSDLSARYGGEEFMSVLTDADSDAATLFAERILARMRALEFPWGAQTVSAGIATYQPGMGSYEVLVGAADRALYDAKAGGRDRVAIAAQHGVRSEANGVVVPEAPASPAAGGQRPFLGRVFVVDDNADLRETLRIALSETGYEVWDSGDPKEAIRHFVSLTPVERPDVIVTDVIMPDMTGMTFIEHLERVTSGLRVIYMSGYVHSPVSWAGASGALVTFLEKPFALDLFVGTVTGMIHAAADERGVPQAPA